MSAARAGRLWLVGALVLGLLLSAAAYLLVIAPARSEAASVQSQVDDATLTQTTLRQRLRALAAASQDTTAIQAAGAAAAAALPVTPDTQGLLRQIQTVAAASRATVGAVAISEADVSVVEGVWAITVTVDLTGTPDDLVAVAAALQTGGGRALTVASATLTTDDGGSTTLTLGVTVYCSSDPGATAGAGASPPAAGSSTGTETGTAGGAADAGTGSVSN